MPFIVFCLLFFHLSAFSQIETLCASSLENSDLVSTCLDYESDERFDLFLTQERVSQCESYFGDWPRTFRMCLRATSRNEHATVEKIRACHNNFYYTYDMRNCLKFSALLSLQEINECGEKYSHRFHPLKGMECISDKVGIWRLEYEIKMFQD